MKIQTDVFTEKLEQIAFIALLGLWAAFTFSSALTEILYGVAIICWLILRFFKPSYKSWVEEKVITIPLITYGLVAIASYFWSENTDLSTRGVLKVLQQISIFFLVLDFFTTTKRKKLFLKWFLFVSSIVVFNGFYQYYVGYDLIRRFGAEMASSGPRVTAAFKSYGIFAAYLVMTTPILVASAWAAFRKKEKTLSLELVVSILLIAGSLLLLFWTRSRGAFLAFGATVFIALVIKKQWKWLLGAFLLGLVGIAMLPKSMIIHLDAEGKEQSIVERYYLWDRALHVIKAKPWGGTGINTYAETHDKYDKTQNWRVRRYYAHNGYLQTAAEVGLPALTIFFIFLWFYFKRGIRSVLKENDIEPFILHFFGAILGAFAFLMLAIVDTVMHNPMPIMTFWYVAGLGLALLRLHEAERVSQSL